MSKSIGSIQQLTYHHKQFLLEADRRLREASDRRGIALSRAFKTRFDLKIPLHVVMEFLAQEARKTRMAPKPSRQQCLRPKTKRAFILARKEPRSVVAVIYRQRRNFAPCVF